MALRNDILLRILTNRIDTRELRDKCRVVNLTFRCSSMRIAFFKPLSDSRKPAAKCADLSITNWCEALCRDTCECYAATDSADNIILIFKDYTQTLTTAAYEQLLPIVARQISKRLLVPVIYALSENTATVSDLPASYLHCIQSVERKEITQSLFKKDSIEQFEKDPAYKFDYSRLTICFETQDQDALKKLLRHYFADMIRLESSNSLEGIKYQLIEFIIYAVEELRSSLLSGAGMEEHKKEAFRIIRSASSLVELEEKLYLLFAEMMNQLNEYGNPNYSQPIQNVLAYVHGNYQDPNLSLKTLAVHLEVNAAYLGRQFALETGEYFSDYLNRIRVAKAVHLLKNTAQKTAAVAKAVGFANITYFFTIFKKIAGGRPGDFRKG